MSPKIRQATAGRSRQFEALTPLASISRCSPGQQVCRQGEPADRWFWIIAGSARRSMIRPDGRRQIVDLLFPGDCFGFTNGREYDDSVEAIARETYVARCVRRDAEAVAETNPQLAGEIRRATFEALWRLQSQLLIVGRDYSRSRKSAPFSSKWPHACQVAPMIAWSCQSPATISRTISDCPSRPSVVR